MAKADYTDKEMAEFDAQVQRRGIFPAGTVFDPTAQARGEPRWRKVAKDAAANRAATNEQDDDEGKP
jgi:hypothetical protein